MKKLNLNAIRIDGGTQARVEINMDAVGDYAEALKVGIELPPVVVFHDGADHWLADGFHRYHAHKQADKASIVADVRTGTLLEAKLFAVGANGSHGLRRTNEDKRRAVQMVLDEPAWKDWSDRNVAEACGVSHTFVASIRRPEVDAKQATNRATGAGRRAAAVESDSTMGETPALPRVATVATYPQADDAQAPVDKPAKRTLDQRPADVAAPTASDELHEATSTIADLAEENQQLRDRLAVEAMDASEEEKTQTAETIRELRALVKTLEAENAALKVSRDTYQREAAEAKKSAIYWRKQAEKAAKDAA